MAATTSRSPARRYVRLLTLVYATVLVASIGFAYWSEEAQTGRASLTNALFGRDGSEFANGAYRDTQAERTASFSRGIAAISTLGYLLCLGLWVGPRKVQLICGNVIILIFLFASTEVGTRFAGVHSPAIVRRGAADRNLWAYDASKGWFNVPHGSGEVPISGPDRGGVRINSIGLRGDEVVENSPGDNRRVLVFGDSFVFGIGVDEEHLFTTYLAYFLRSRDAEKEYEVLNMGVTGYSTDQQYLLLQEIGMRLLPDLVILVVCDNDFEGNTQDFVYRRYYKPWFELDPNGKLIAHNVPVPTLSRAQRVKLFLAQESNLWNLARNRRSNIPLLERFLRKFEVGVNRTQDVDSVELTATLIRHFAERVEATGAKFLVINTAHRGERTPLFHNLRPRLVDPNIHQLGLEEFLGNARRDAPDMNWDFPEDIHWNRDSHRLAAEIVAGHIVRNALLP